MYYNLISLWTSEHCFFAAGMELKISAMIKTREIDVIFFFLSPLYIYTKNCWQIIKLNSQHVFNLLIKACSKVSIGYPLSIIDLNRISSMVFIKVRSFCSNLLLMLSTMTSLLQNMIDAYRQHCHCARSPLCGAFRSTYFLHSPSILELFVSEHHQHLLLQFLKYS